MTIEELTRRVRANAKKRTHEERISLLKDAHIIDSKGEIVDFLRASSSPDKRILKSANTRKTYC